MLGGIDSDDGGVTPVKVVIEGPWKDIDMGSWKAGDKPTLKVGVSVRQDVTELQRVVPFTPGGFIELSERARKLGYEQTGLRTLTALLLGQRLSKGAQMSNWAKPCLDQRQIDYAATDAWISGSGV